VGRRDSPLNPRRSASLAVMLLAVAAFHFALVLRKALPARIRHADTNTAGRSS
jgi:hypothetical protein